MKKHFLLISLLALITACNPNKKIINSGEAVITQINGNIVYCQDEVSAKFKQLSSDDYSIFFLTRHAEKVKTGADPDLLPEGKERAHRLANILELIELDMICSSPYKRTRATAEVCASTRKMEITEYNPKSNKQNAFFTDLMNNQPSSRVLVVGHSNTIPELLNFFVQESVYNHIDDDDYDNFYMVAVKDGKPGKIWNFQY